MHQHDNDIEYASSASDAGSGDCTQIKKQKRLELQKEKRRQWLEAHPELQ
jgi:hypothetical protein